MYGEIGQFQNFDLLRLGRDEVRIVIDDAVFIFLEKGGNPPDLVVDLDRVVLLDLDLDPLVRGIGQRKTLAIGADNAGDLLGRNGRFTLGIDVLQIRRTRKCPVGFSYDERLPILSHDDLIELLLAVGTEITQVVLLFIGQQIPLLVLCHFLPLLKKFMKLKGTQNQISTFWLICQD